MATFVLAAALAVLLAFFAWWGCRRHRALLASVEEVRLPAVHSRLLENARDIVIYLPPGYRRDPERRYPVLYLNDGQERDELGLRETLARLYRRGEIRPLIAVAIPTNDDRLREYGTAVAPNAQGLGDRAVAYHGFVVEELRPLVEGRFRTNGEAGFLGASLGGLSAFDLVWNRPDLFSTVGVFSGSFWWRAAPGETDNPPDARIAHAMVRGGRYRPGFRAWFQAGTRDEVCDRDGNGVIDAIQDTTELINELEKLGYRLGRELAYMEIAGGRHDWPTWARVLPNFLRWAYGGELSADFADYAD